MRAVRFDRYGGREVLRVEEVPDPLAGPGEAVVEMRAAGINPGEASIREGRLHAVFPATFPSGQGSDLAGVVTAVGDGVTDLAVGDEVLGFSHSRSSHAELVAVPAGQLVRKPAEVPWEVAGGLFVAGTTAWSAVEAVAAKAGETVVVSAAAGGVGGLVVQLLGRHGVRVIGIASESNAGWLRDLGVVPVGYGDGLADRVREAAPGGVDALIDLFGPEYLDLAVDLGVAPARIETIISFERAAAIGASTKGSAESARAEVLAELAGMLAAGELVLPVAATFPLDRVADAFELLEGRHVRGKVVLVP